MFSKQDTKAIKGIAVILMLFHHLAGFPERWPVGFEGFTPALFGLLTPPRLKSLAGSAKLCVSLFFFLGGYGLYKRFTTGKFHLFDTILSLFKQYWKVFFILIPIAYLFFSRTGDDINQLCQRYAIGKSMIPTILSDVTTYTYALNSEWWFLGSYLCVLPLGYMFCFLPRPDDHTRGFLRETLLVLVIDILLRSVYPALAELPELKGVLENLYFSRFFKLNATATDFFAGIVAAKYGVLDDLKRRLAHLTLSLPCSLALSAAAFLFQFIFVGFAADVILIPLMIASLAVALDRLKPIQKAFLYLGKHSTNMWLIHSFYCYYFLEVTHLVYCTQNVWIDLAILVLLSLLSSIALEAFYKRLGRVWSKLTSRTAARPKAVSP